MKYLIICLLSIFTLSFTNLVFAQNPKQTAKYKKRSVKKEKEKENLKGTYRGIAKDSDEDGVQDYTDKCPGTPKGEKVTPFGCPFDTDFDGLYDYEDLCINEKGPRENGGCPWGDKDSDNIPDNLDECPEFAGIPKFKGCPDTDKDGVKDSEDQCPNQFGPVANKGCPDQKVDTDGDGLFDNEDLCPKSVGLRSNRGCPDLKPEEKKALQKAFDNLLFESAKDVIIPSSYPSLNELAIILTNNPIYKLHLEGHTDNVGDDHKNLVLSQKRAESTKKYLETRGVPADRITAAGFGETRPKTENDTESGRKMNRRVEMTISME